tara:strand:- start:185 stop:346 length:162 start_codon:yes stop_codon:yes gene_type:complete
LRLTKLSHIIREILYYINFRKADQVFLVNTNKGILFVAFFGLQENGGLIEMEP